MNGLARFAPLVVSVLISFLAYGSQVLFIYIEPYTLERQQALLFNALLTCLWICYARACLTDPGHVPDDWFPVVEKGGDERPEHVLPKSRWCKKCKKAKPPRAHHCKTCQR